jgi:hypothetical protein
VTGLIAVLSPAGVPRDYLHAAAAILTAEQDQHVTPADIDTLLGQLADASLITFSADGATISAHRLVMRVIREQRLHERTLAGTAATAIALLEDMSQSIEPAWQHREAARELIQQVTALHGHFATLPPGSGADSGLLRLRQWTLYFLNELGDNPAQAISIGEPLTGDSERILGPAHPDTLASRNNLANAYQEAGRAADAITLHEQNLADRERILGPGHPDTLKTRDNLAIAYREAGRAGDADTLLHPDPGRQ